MEDYLLMRICLSPWLLKSLSQCLSSAFIESISQGGKTNCWAILQVKDEGSTSRKSNQEILILLLKHIENFEISITD